MSEKRLKEVITEPARARCVRYEDGLAAIIARDAGNGPVLPLLEFALTQLWEDKRGPEISHAAYQAIGGVAGALSRYAENVYTEDLLKQEQFPMERIRRVLLALVRSRGGAADATRRVVSRGQLGADWGIARTLARHRLVTIGCDDSGTETAELAHEALIREWPTLQEWVEDDSVFQRWLTSAEERAANRELLPDNRIREADQWLDERAEDIPPKVQQLIQDSKSEQHRRETQLRNARNQDEARRLAALAESVLATDERSLQIPLLLGIEALRKASVREADSAIRRTMRTAARPVTLANHEEPVRAVMFSRDGTRLAVASGDDHGGAVQVIDAATGAEISRIAHRIPANKVAFSPDGTRLAVASGDDHGGAVQVIDAATGAEFFRLDYSPRLNAAVFSLDGTRLAIANGWHRGEGGARVFDAVTGSEISHLDHGNPVSLDPTRWLYDKMRTQIHSRPVRAVAFSPDGTRAATATNGPLGGGGDARVFEVATGTEIWNWDHGGPVHAVAFSPDGTRLATASGGAQGDGQARVFEVATGTEIWNWDHGRLVHAVAFSPDGARLATASGDYQSHGGGDARVIDTVTGAVIWRIDHGSPVHAVAFSPDGTRLTTVSHKYLGDTMVRVFDVASGVEISRLDHGSPVHAVVFSPDGTRLATASGDDCGGVAWVFNAATGAEIWRRADLSVNKLVFSPNGTRLATGSGNEAWVFDTATGAEVFCLAHGNAVNKVVFSPDGTRLATASCMYAPGGGSRGDVRVFDATAGAEIWHTDHSNPVNRVAFSPDGTRLATATSSRDDRCGMAWVFNAATGAEIWRVEHNWLVRAVVFSPDGTRLATASGPVYDPSGEARVFEATTGAEIWRVDHGNPVHAVVFSPDGTRLATGSGEYRNHSAGDGDLRVFDAATGAEIWRVDHGNPVRAVVFSPDGTRLATGSGVDLLNYPYPRDGRVRLFDLANGEEVSCLDHGQPVRAVAFSPDGTQLASSDDSVRVWCVDHSQLIEQALGRLTRNLTRQEWSSYFHGEPYRKTRADLP